MSALSPGAGHACWLLTTHGEVLCRDASGALVVRRFERVGQDAVEIVLPDRTGFGPEFLRFLAGDATPPVPAVIATGPLAGFTVRPGMGRSTIALLRDGAFFRIDPHSRRVSTDGTELDVATSFVVLGASDRRVLRGLLDGEWVWRGSLERLAPGAIRLGWPYRLQVGDTFLDLRHHLPFEGSQLPYRVSVFRDGWRVDELCLYRPLLHLAAFGADAVARLPDLLTALARDGDHAGEVMLVTDARAEALESLDPARLTIHRVDPAQFDQTGPAARMLARHALMDLPQMLRFQPVLMLDAGVLVAGPLEPLLRELAVSEQICASLEPAARRRAAPFIGLSLAQRAGLDLRGLAGIDGQVLGVPNLVTHGHALRLARRIALNRHVASKPKPPMPWLEQEVLNYVAAASVPFDTHLLERFLGDADSIDRPLLRFAMDAKGRAALDGRLRATRWAASAGLRPSDSPLDEPVGPP